MSKAKTKADAPDTARRAQLTVETLPRQHYDR